MKIPEIEEGNESSKLRRWVSNLQLESWQLELLITGFSIFLLATSLDPFDEFKNEFLFNKVKPAGESMNPVMVVPVIFILNAISIILKFMLFNLLIHLLLRGFWIGIVGLSSVSSKIYFEKLEFKGAFKKYIPNNVRSLDGLIVFLDKVSSVIFAYTYLLVFSILSVVIISGFIFSILGLFMWLSTAFPGHALASLANIVLIIILLLWVVTALLFFIDTLLFSTFKKSKWFTPIYYPIYRFFSIISFSFVYRSIYYHLISNFKKKQIVIVALILIGVFFIGNKITKWDNYKYFPDRNVISESLISVDVYDDTRKDNFIDKVSIPSRYVSNGFLEIFVRYDASDNMILELLCPEVNDLNGTAQITQGLDAGNKAKLDTTLTLTEILSGGDEYIRKIKSALTCTKELYEIFIDEKKYSDFDLMYYIHSNKNEKGLLVVLDIDDLERGQHLLEIRKIKFEGLPFISKITKEKLAMKSFVKLNFWKE